MARYRTRRPTIPPGLGPAERCGICDHRQHSHKIVCPACAGALGRAKRLGLSPHKPALPCAFAYRTRAIESFKTALAMLRDGDDEPQKRA